MAAFETARWFRRPEGSFVKGSVLWFGCMETALRVSQTSADPRAPKRRGVAEALEPKATMLNSLNPKAPEPGPKP